MQCNNCGFPISEDSSVCSNCGQEVKRDKKRPQNILFGRSKAKMLASLNMVELVLSDTRYTPQPNLLSRSTVTLLILIGITILLVSLLPLSTPNTTSSTSSSNQFTHNGPPPPIGVTANSPSSGPNLSVNPNSLDSSNCSSNGNNIYSCQVTLSEDQSATVNWSVSDDNNLGISFSQSIGTLSSGNTSQSITISNIPCQNGSFTFSGSGANSTTAHWNCSQPTPYPPPTSTPSPVQRTLTSQQTQSQTVNATGQGTTQGTQATGSILIANGDLNNPLNLPAGSHLTNTQGCTAQGLQVSLDNDVSIPAYSGNGPWPTMTVSIHVIQPGVAGNIQDCSSTDQAFWNPTLTFDAHDLNGGFTGGADPQTYTVVKQSDIDTAANSLTASTRQSAVADLNSQLQSNEQLVGDPQCTYNTTSDHAAGDQATTVTVTVQATCTATAST